MLFIVSDIKVFYKDVVKYNRVVAKHLIKYNITDKTSTVSY